MKRKSLMLFLALLLTLLSAVPVSAAEYGVIYDETELLWSQELEDLGTQQLPRFTQDYEIDLRVDVLTSLVDFETIADAAAGIYDGYAYGFGDGRNGVSLTVLVHPDEEGVVMEEWYVYAAGDRDELITDGLQRVLTAVETLMTDENWAGDARQDAQALTSAVSAMKDSLEDFFSVSPPVAETVGPDTFPSAGEAIGYVTDTAGLMTAEERATLEQKAREISETHGFGVYLMTVDSFQDSTDSFDIFDGATTLYNKYDLGLDEERKGVLLLLSMKGRDFALITYSDYGNYVFDEESREEMTTYFLDDFAADDWYSGFAHYLEAVSELLTDGPGKLQSEIRTLTGIIFLVPLVIAVIGIKVLGGMMKSVATATQAEMYIGGLALTNSYDNFTHSTETRKKRKEESDDGDRRSSTRSKSSGGFGGTTGKF